MIEKGTKSVLFDTTDKTVPLDLISKESEFKTLTTKYYNWLSSQTTCKEIDGWIEITTPFLDRHNDCLQIYARKMGEQWLLSDDGYIISDLEMCGLDFETSNNQEVLSHIVKRFGIETKYKQLFVEATEGNIHSRQHSLLQAMILISNMSKIVNDSTKEVTKENNKLQSS